MAGAGLAGSSTLTYKNLLFCRFLIINPNMNFIGTLQKSRFWRVKVYFSCLSDYSGDMTRIGVSGLGSEYLLICLTVVDFGSRIRA